MAYDSTKPAIADNYSTGYTQTIRDNFDFVLKMGEGLSVTGTTPTNAKRYNPTNDYFEYYTGSAWALLPLDYLRKAGGGAQTCTQDTNFTGVLQKNGQTVWYAGNFDPDAKANLVGASFTGAISTTTTVTASQRLFGNGASGNNGLGKVTITTTTTAPTGGSQGDIHVIY
jgi:hypothetical protein